MANGKPFKSRKKELKCIENHTLFGFKDYEEMCKSVGFKEIYTETALIDTKWGEKPKFFLYLGEKI